MRENEMRVDGRDDWCGSLSDVDLEMSEFLFTQALIVTSVQRVA